MLSSPRPERALPIRRNTPGSGCADGQRSLSSAVPGTRMSGPGAAVREATRGATADGHEHYRMTTDPMAVVPRPAGTDWLQWASSSGFQIRMAALRVCLKDSGEDSEIVSAC